MGAGLSCAKADNGERWLWRLVRHFLRHWVEHADVTPVHDAPRLVANPDPERSGVAAQR